MKFCIECGEKLTENVKFCTSCGAKIVKTEENESVQTEIEAEDLPKTGLISENDQVAATEQPIQQETNEQPRELTSTYEEKHPEPNVTQHTNTQQRKSNKKRNMVIGSIVVLLLLIFGIHKGIAHYLDPMNELKAMDDAINSEDVKTFLSYIQFEDDALIDEESFFEYMKQEFWDHHVKPQYLNIIERDKQQSNPLDVDIYNEFGEALFKVKKEKKFFLYPSFELVAIPVELYAMSNMPDTTLTILDQAFTISEEETRLTKAYQGLYTIQATNKNEYGEFVYEDTMIIDTYPNNYIDIAFETFSTEVYYDEQYANAILYINNEATDKKLSDVDSLGPLPMNAKMKLHAIWKDRDGNELLSNSVTIGEEEDYYGSIYFEFDERNKMVATDLDNEEVGQFILEFREAYEDAVNYIDFQMIQNYLKPDSPAEKGLRDFVKDMEDGYYYYDFLENTVLSVKETEKNKYEVKTNEKFEFRDDDWKWYAYDRDKLYHVEVDEDRMQIVKIDYLDTKKKSLD